MWLNAVRSSITRDVPLNEMLQSKELGEYRWGDLERDSVKLISHSVKMNERQGKKKETNRDSSPFHVVPQLN